MSIGAYSIRYLLYLVEKEVHEFKCNRQLELELIEQRKSVRIEELDFLCGLGIISQEQSNKAKEDISKIYDGLLGDIQNEKIN